MFWKSKSSAVNNQNEEIKPAADVKGAVKAEPSKDDSFVLFECDHYQYELARCGTIKTRLNDYYSGVNSQKDCSHLEDLFASCLDWYRDPKNNLAAFKKLYDYEAKFVAERKKAAEANDVWEKRTTPPSDWNSPLPDWCVERLKETVWYKSREGNSTK